MKENTDRFLQDLKSVFIYSSGYIKEDSRDIRVRIQKQMAITNCKRILVMMPVFLGMALFAFFELFVERHSDSYRRPVWKELSIMTPHTLCVLSALLFIALVIYSVIIIWHFYVCDPEGEHLHCSVLYRSFWVVWTVSMAFISLGHALKGHGIGFYMVVCFLICIVPLCTLRDFIYSIIGVCILAGSMLALIGVADKDFRGIFGIAIFMMMLGFIAQRCEVEMWTLREYVYMTAYLDTLTHLLGRRGGNALMEQELKKRGGRSELGVIMLDIDFFKKYNDSFGHDAGDYCLKAVGECIRKAAEERTQIMIRHGGEEFVLVLFDATAEETIQQAEKIRKAVFDMGLPAPYREAADVVTVSVGATVVTASEEKMRYESTLKMADMALYEAKEAGRNQVVFR